MATKVAIISQTVPSGFCPIKDSDWQQLVALLSGTFTGDPNFNFGNTTPTPTNRGKPWFRTNTDGTPDRWYVFAQGAWLSQHPIATGLIQIYTGDETTIDTLDGGEAGAVSTISGPMWQRVTQLDAKFPIGVGTLPSSATVGVLDTGGEEKHSLDVTEIPPHSHNTGSETFTIGSGAGTILLRPDSIAAALPKQATSSVGGSASVVVAHNTMPPYCGVFFLVKSARRFYRINA